MGIALGLSVNSRARGGTTVTPILTTPEISGVPHVAGTAQEGQVLTASPAPATGLPVPTRSWQWVRDGIAISGATNATYTLRAADVGAMVHVVQRETNAAGAAQAQSAATARISAATTAPVISGVPTVTGTPQEGQILTATPATATGQPTPTRTWQWVRDGAAISGATNATYTLRAADVGAVVHVVQRETNAAGAAQAQSAATAQISAATTAPIISGVPSITGTPQEGQILTATPAAATGEPTPTRTWQWVRDGAAISGATHTSYTLTSADVGATIRVEQHETNTAGTAQAQSTATAPITGRVVEPPAAPQLSGTSADQSTGVFSFTTTEGGTLHWAIYTAANGAPTLQGDGSWNGSTEETGSVPIPQAGTGSVSLEYTTTTGDRLIYGLIGADNRSSNLVTTPFTPQETPGTAPALSFVGGTQQEADLAGGAAESWANALPAAGDYLVIVHSLNAGAGHTLDIEISGSQATQITRLADTSGAADLSASTSLHLVRASGASSLSIAQHTPAATGNSIVRYVEVYASDIALSATAVVATATERHAISSNDWSIATTLPSVPANHSVLTAFTDREGAARKTTWTGDFTTEPSDHEFIRGGIHLYSSKKQDSVAAGDFAATATNTATASLVRYFSLIAVAVKGA